MTPRSWIRRLFTRTPRRAPQGPRKAPPRFRPSLDVLEDRLTPSNYVPANPVTLVSGLSLPNGVAVDGAGDVFIADYRNGAVKEWHASTRTVSTLVSSGRLNQP
jgi:hypothetical protein